MRSLATAASAVLLALAVQVPWLAPVGLVALVPWLVACERENSFQAAAMGAGFGLVYGVSLSTWLPGALSNLGATTAQSIAGQLAVCAWAGAPVFAALGVVAQRLAGRGTGAQMAGLAVAVFAIEWLVSLTWWGVPWGLLGYSQLGVLGVAQVASAGGVPLVSAGLAAGNLAAAGVLRGRSGAGRWGAALCAGWLALALAGLPLAEAVRPAGGDGQSTEILVVQPDIPRSDRWVRSLQPLNAERVRRQVDGIPEERRAGVAALALPENLLTAPLNRDPELAARVQAWVDELGLPVLAGLVLAASPPAEGSYRSSVVWLEPRVGISARVHKHRAIPVLESDRGFPGRAGLAALLGSAGLGPRVEEAPAAEPLIGPVPAAVALCYEVLFPGVVQRRRAADSLAIFNLADDSWVSGEAATRHLTRIARFRAIEQRLPLVRVAHGGLSAVVDPFGRVVEELPLDSYAATRVSLPPAAPPLHRERLAILGLPLAAGLVVWWLAGRVRALSGQREGAP